LLPSPAQLNYLSFSCFQFLRNLTMIKKVMVALRDYPIMFTFTTLNNICDFQQLTGATCLPIKEQAALNVNEKTLA
jgi:hypothetical protein